MKKLYSAEKLNIEKSEVMKPQLLSIWPRMFALLLTFLCSMAMHQEVKAAYCAPTFSGGGGTCGGLLGTFYVSGASVSGTSFYTGGTCGSNPNLYTTTGATVTEGGTYTINLVSTGTASFSFSENFAVYIDFNNDGDFNDAGENVMPNISFAGGTTAPSPTSPSFTVTAPGGDYRMRVLLMSGSTTRNQYTITDACYNNSGTYGEYKDFNFHVNSAVACSGTPAVASITPANSTVCAGNSTTLGLTGLASAGGYTYQWKSSTTSGGPYSNAVGASTSYTYATSTSLAVKTYFVCQVTCSNSGAMTQSNETSVDLNSFLNCYCAPVTITTAPIAGRCLAGVNLVGNTVTLNTSTGVGGSSPSYSTYTSTPVVDMSLNASYTIKVKAGTGTASNHYFRAWIDYDRDGVFSSGESIGSIGPVVGSSANPQYNLATFTVPGTAIAGQTRLRVMYQFGGTVNAGGACTYSQVQGETEDYLVSLTAAGCSGAPSAGNVYTGSSGTTATATICPNATQAMFISGQTSGVSGITYKWQSATTAGGTYSDIAGATSTSYTTPPLTNATTSPLHYYYKCLITCTNSGSTDIQTTPVDVTVSPSPTLTINGSNAYTTSTCNGTGVALAVSNGSTGTTTYSWSPTANVSPISTASSITATPLTTTTYTVTGTANTCTATATAAITINPDLVTFTPNNPSVAIGGAVSITASAASSNGGVNYVWVSSATLNTTTGATVTANPLSNTVYTVTATDPLGCTRTNTVAVNVSSGTPGLVGCGYLFSTGTASYTAISGATSLGSSGNSNYTVDLSTGTPFNFDFNGITYNKFGVSGNGFVYLGGTAPAATTTAPIALAGGPEAVISAWGASLAGLGTVSYSVTGTAPSRVLKIQWSIYSSQATDAQVILYEHTHATNPDLIQLSYRDQSGFFGTNMSAAVQIGLRGATNADYNNRSQAAGSNMTRTSTSQGASSSAVVQFNASTYESGAILWSYTPTITTPTITPTGQQNICTGGAGVTLTASTTVPSPQYQWLNFSAGTNIGGATTSSYLANPAGAGNYFYAIKVSNTAGTCSRTSSAAAVVAANCCTTNNWTGTSVVDPTDWFTAGNWSCGIIPTSSTDVVIPNTVTTFPVLSGVGGLTGYAKDLTIQSGASVTVSGSLEVYGHFANSGAAAMGNGKVSLKGTSAQNITGANNFKNLEISNASGVTVVSGAQKVSGILSLVAGTLTTGGNLTIASTASGTGLIDNFTTGYTGGISGNITVQRYATNTGSPFMYISSPVSGADISDWNFPNSGMNGATNGSQVQPDAACSQTALLVTSPYAGIFDYREEAVTYCNLQGWHTRFSGGINSGEGYIGRVPSGTTLSLTGGFISGSSAVTSPTLFNSSTNTTSSKGFNLVANPFAAPIEWTAVAAGNSGIQGTAYVFQVTGGLSGTYKSVNQITGNEEIGSSQAFFVDVNNALPSTTIAFTKSMMRNGTNVLLRTAAPYEQLLTLNVSGNGHADKLRLAFGANFTEGFDRDFDARKMHSIDGQPSLFATDATTEYSILAQPSTIVAQHVPVSLIAGANGTFTISADDLGTFDATTPVYLEDRKLNIIQDLKANSNYTFTASSNDDAARFVVHFTAKTDENTSVNNVKAEATAQITGWENKVTVTFKNYADAEVKLTVYDVMGRIISGNNKVSTTGTCTMDMPEIVNGYYFVQVVSTSKTVTQKVYLGK